MRVKMENHKIHKITYINIEGNQERNSGMQQYRGNQMPYNQYRQMPPAPCTVKHPTWDEKPIAMAYVPWQEWRDIYEAEKAFSCGTIFKELNKPFVGKRGNMR